MDAVLLIGAGLYVVAALLLVYGWRRAKRPDTDDRIAGAALLAAIVWGGVGAALVLVGAVA